jgi:hypothetical protein
VGRFEIASTKVRKDNLSVLRQLGMEPFVGTSLSGYAISADRLVGKSSEIIQIDDITPFLTLLSVCISVSSSCLPGALQ